jgi:hypothetical protein
MAVGFARKDLIQMRLIAVVGWNARTPPERPAAEAAALRRWSDDLLAEFPLIAAYGAVVDAIDLPMQDTATAAEMKRRGGGLAYIVSELSGREVLQNAGSRPEGSQDSKA